MTTVITDAAQGVDTDKAVKVPVKAATTANITLSGEQTIDGVSIVADDRVLVKNQTDQTKNGIYKASATAWSRTADFDGNRDVTKGTQVYVLSGGATNGDKLFIVSTANPVVVGTSNITFTESAYGASDQAADALTYRNEAEAFRDEAEGFKNDAEAAAASIDLPDPTGNALLPLRANAGETANEYAALNATGIAAGAITMSKLGLAQDSNGTLNANTITWSVTDGAWKKITVTGAGTIDITPQSSLVNGGIIEIVNGGVGSITWTGVDEWIGGSQPSLPSSGTSYISVIHDGSGNVIGNYLGDI